MIAVLSGLSWGKFAAEAGAAIDDPGVRGVVVAAGAGLGERDYPSDTTGLGSVLRRIETSGKPFVAAIAGRAIGAGYEICLACHYRVAADDDKTQIGSWDPQSGWMPGLGATQRLPRLLGVQLALELLLDGRTLNVREAKKAGLVDEVVPPDGLMAAAHDWILTANKTPRIPASTVPPQFGVACALLREKTLGLYPAPLAILSSVFEGCQVDLETGLKIEARYFAYTRGTPEARNLGRLFQWRQELDGLVARPASVPKSSFTKIGILGAGMMGSGIAYACADAGLEVVLLDTTAENAGRGRAAAIGIFEKRVAKGGLSAEARDRAAARILATCDYRDLAGADAVIEAVFEDRAIKADVTRKTEAITGDAILFASNTSTLPITGLAAAWPRPENFIGMHFFSPVDRMPLVEIIRGKRTSDASLARALDLAGVLRKTPILVNDSPGFYTSRVFATYVNEGMAMLLEGTAPALIENAGRLAGMPVGPLVLADEVSLDLLRQVRGGYETDPVDKVLRIMIDQCGRHGKKTKQGFYEYPAGGRKQLWPDLARWFPPRTNQPDAGELIRRFRWIQSLETIRCMEEGVVEDRRDADVGSVLGWSFCPALGGTVGHIESVGIKSFIAESERLAMAYGERFAPPELLRKMQSGM